jgi:hypothetical protein
MLELSSLSRLCARAIIASLGHPTVRLQFERLNLQQADAILTCMIELKLLDASVISTLMRTHHHEMYLWLDFKRSQRIHARSIKRIGGTSRSLHPSLTHVSDVTTTELKTIVSVNLSGCVQFDETALAWLKGIQIQ